MRHAGETCLFHPVAGLAAVALWFHTGFLMLPASLVVMWCFLAVLEFCGGHMLSAVVVWLHFVMVLLHFVVDLLQFVVVL